MHKDASCIGLVSDVVWRLKLSAISSGRQANQVIVSGLCKTLTIGSDNARRVPTNLAFCSQRTTQKPHAFRYILVCQGSLLAQRSVPHPPAFSLGGGVLLWSVFLCVGASFSVPLERPVPGLYLIELSFRITMNRVVFPLMTSRRQLQRPNDCPARHTTTRSRQPVCATINGALSPGRPGTLFAPLAKVPRGCDSSLGF
mgnify:CR=1 FL=1